MVELRYFAGLSEAEIAALLKRSERSVRRDWQKARLYLLASLQGLKADGRPMEADRWHALSPLLDELLELTEQSRARRLAQIAALGSRRWPTNSRH